ncbi:MAG TPA: zf-HC2 domain-containing protein [Gaiellaceae bacterium]|nr:zf-HC2 domain-containing protein [Gaiellaceae bacterium]
MSCGCGDCEQMMQPYLDGVLSDEQVREAQAHLACCPGCDKRYRFEVTLRRFVRVAASEEMPPELRLKLSSLRPSA